MRDKRHGGREFQPVAALAAQQLGVVSREQLRARGLSDRQIANRIAAGFLHPVFHGVFAVGHPAISRQARMLAAVLACGRRTVVSHGSAAELLGLWSHRPALVDVIAPNEAGRKIPGIRRRFVHVPTPGEKTIHLAVPCTTASRTIVDLAGSLGESSLRRLVEQAAALDLLRIAEIDRALGARRRRGAPRLRAILSAWRNSDGTMPRLRSGLEARLLAAAVEAGLPRPRCNVKLRVLGHFIEVDLLWEEQRLVVETDGVQTHLNAVAFRRDRWRDQLLLAAGYRTSRVTWDQLEDEPKKTIERLRRSLEFASEPG